MASSNEQHVCINFCIKLCKTAAETVLLLEQAFGSAAPSRGRVFDWHKRFREGHVSAEDNERSWRPSSSRTDDAKAQISEILDQDRRKTLREISAESGFSYATCQRIVTCDLAMKRVAAKFIPKLLNPDHKKNRMLICQDMQLSLADDPDLFSKIITGDEAWVYGYDPETKFQSLQWKSLGSPRPKKARQSRSQVKVMLIVFFDISGVVHHEYIPKGQTVNQHVYKEVLIHLQDAIRRKRLEL